MIETTQPPVFALGTFRQIGPALVRDGRAYPLSVLGARVAAFHSLLDIVTAWDAAWPALAEAARALPDSGIDATDLVAELPLRPGQLFGAGANYRKHVIDLIVDHGAGDVGHLSKDERRKVGEELMDRRAAHGKPFVFTVPSSAIAGPDTPLVLPYDITQPDWELELAVVIGKPARRVSPARALDHVAGYLIANDLTARELVDRPDVKQMGMDWLACKGVPGFKILGPLITPAAFVADPQKLHIRLTLNGAVMQDEGTADMIFPVARLISFVSNHVQLNPGDMIMTGSPSGNGTHYGRFLRDGDVMDGFIDGLEGVQHVTCVAERLED